MHIYAQVRGLISALRDWENFMSSQYLPFEVLEKGDKKPSKYLAQLQVREIKLYEIVCPKECEDQVMAMLKPGDLYGAAKIFNKPMRLLARLLGLKKPSTTWKANILPPMEGIALTVIGTKDDKMNWVKKKNNDVFVKGDMPKENL